MADDAWVQETPEPQDAPPPKKKLVPTWLWFCGAGCLLVVILVAVGGFFLVGVAKDAVDKDKIWAELDQVLPYEQRPEHLDPQLRLPVPLEMYWLEDHRGFAVFVYYEDGSVESVRKQAMDVDTAGGFLGMGERTQAEEGTIEVQGRTIPLVRFVQEGYAAGAEAAPGAIPGGAGVILDLSPEDQSAFLGVMLIRGQSEDQEQPVTDEEIRAFLEPFDVPAAG